MAANQPANDPTTPSILDMMKAGAKGFASDAKSVFVHRGDAGKAPEPAKPAPTISEKVGRKVSPGFGKLLDALGPQK